MTTKRSNSPVPLNLFGWTDSERSNPQRFYLDDTAVKEVRKLIESRRDYATKQQPYDDEEARAIELSCKSW